LDEQWELKDGGWSEGLLRNAVWLSGLVAYGEVETILERVGQVAMSDSSVWRKTQVWGERLEEVLEGERRQANAPPIRWERPQPPQERGRMGAAMDGCMVYILEEGWKEMKISCIFDIVVRPGLDEVTKEPVEQAHAVNNSYAAHLGGPDPLGEKLWAEAHRRGWEGAKDTQVLGDGAPWIWNQAALHFADSQQTIDWRHAQSHLATAAHLYKGEGTPASQRWFHAQSTTLYQGHAARIAADLRTAAAERPDVAAALLTEAEFFLNHQRRMQYLEQRENLWLIGSGMVESGAKQYKDRFTGPGMRWSRSGAEHLLPIRSAIMSDRFDRLWQQARNSPPA
jgi:hypothetical protein